MKNRIEALRSKAMAAVDRQKSIIATAETDKGRAFTADEQTAFDAAGAEVDTIAGEVKRLEALAAREEAVAAMGANVKDTTPATIKAVTGGNTATRASVVSDLTGSQRVGLAAIAAGKHLQQPSKAALAHLSDMGFDRLADDCHKMAGEVNKTFAIGTANTADNTIVTPLSSEYIETLRNNSIFLRAGPVMLDMPVGSIKIAGGLSGASVGYTTLGTDIPYGQATTRQMSMSAKQLRAVTAYDNYSAEASPLAIATIVGDDLSMQAALAIDSAGLRGDGTGANPSGLYTLAGAGQRIADGSAALAPTIAQVETLTGAMLTKYRISNVMRRRPYWHMSNRVFVYLSNLRTSLGPYAYPKLQDANPTWIEGIPVLVSEQVPSNLGAGTNESEIYLADYGHVYMGLTRALTLMASKEASYVNASAQLVSAFSRDETVIRAMAAHDFGLRQQKAVVIGTTVKWGA